MSWLAVTFPRTRPQDFAAPNLHLSRRREVPQLFDRLAADQTLAHRQALEYAIETGRGSLWLNFTAEQYKKLLR